MTYTKLTYKPSAFSDVLPIKCGFINSSRFLGYYKLYYSYILLAHDAC